MLHRDVVFFGLRAAGEAEIERRSSLEVEDSGWLEWASCVQGASMIDSNDIIGSSNVKIKYADTMISAM